eukprot:2977954-Alexandrium_andersonii.AAC.1
MGGRAPNMSLALLSSRTVIKGALRGYESGSGRCLPFAARRDHAVEVVNAAVQNIHSVATIDAITNPLRWAAPHPSQDMPSGTHLKVRMQELFPSLRVTPPLLWAMHFARLLHRHVPVPSATVGFANQGDVDS